MDRYPKLFGNISRSVFKVARPQYILSQGDYEVLQMQDVPGIQTRDLKFSWGGLCWFSKATQFQTVKSRRLDSGDAATNMTMYNKSISRPAHKVAKKPKGECTWDFDMTRVHTGRAPTKPKGGMVQPEAVANACQSATISPIWYAASAPTKAKEAAPPLLEARRAITR